MLVTVKLLNEHYEIDTSRGINISIPIVSGKLNPKAFWAPDPLIEPVETENFIGDTAQGGLVNFKNVFYNPHGNGTHTECVGHIATESYNLFECLKEHHFIAKLVTIDPEFIDDDYVITEEQVTALDLNSDTEAIIIRTLPNEIQKRHKDWSGTNPPYIHHKAVQQLVELGIKHLLIDLPSVDKEIDEGKLLAHKAFWQYPSINIRKEATITEMVYIPDEVEDDVYFLNIQVSPIALDASSSNIIIYPLHLKK